ncbi:hypothetical protein AK812_SmicGene42724 [Symbiodinium microadriaticum]|uniref:Uncharacterized protein n=1 Tax=Symbiodinium microadriaticum TaxID=2951 RepID=A0A1Q9C2T8_SYMMI|nr:hypothetical protein AK812_SmicGene42724 [Symbiodinium microadriaticum]
MGRSGFPVTPPSEKEPEWQHHASIRFTWLVDALSSPAVAMGTFGIAPLSSRPSSRPQSARSVSARGSRPQSARPQSAQSRRSEFDGIAAREGDGPAGATDEPTTAGRRILPAELGLAGRRVLTLPSHVDNCDQGEACCWRWLAHAAMNMPFNVLSAADPAARCRVFADANLQAQRATHWFKNLEAQTAGSSISWVNVISDLGTGW